MKQLIFSVAEFTQAIIVPAFQDLTPSMPYENTLFDWTPIDLRGTSSRRLLNIRRTGNILQRRDASCDLIYKKMMGTSIRKITAEELYAAVKHCGHEFYQGCLKDFRANDPVFARNILPFFQAAVRQDIVTNGYFGDPTKAANDASEFSTTMYKGALPWLKDYVAAGITPADQTFAIANQNLRANPVTAFNAFEACYDKQNVLMRNMPAGMKAYKCSQNALDGLVKYYQSIGQSTPELVRQYQNGVKVYAHQGIEIHVEPTWEPILAEISGNANAAWVMLTLRGNFAYAYDSLYGEGEDMKTALMVWYEPKDLSWYYQTFLKGGTQIALPEHITFGITNF